LVASIIASPEPHEQQALAGLVQAAGADAIELNVSSLHGMPAPGVPCDLASGPAGHDGCGPVRWVQPVLLCLSGRRDCDAVLFVNRYTPRDTAIPERVQVLPFKVERENPVRNRAILCLLKD